MDKELPSADAVFEAYVIESVKRVRAESTEFDDAAIANVVFSARLNYYGSHFQRLYPEHEPVPAPHEKPLRKGNMSFTAKRPRAHRRLGNRIAHEFEVKYPERIAAYYQLPAKID